MRTHYRLLLISALSDDFSIVGDYRNNTIFYSYVGYFMVV